MWWYDFVLYFLKYVELFVGGLWGILFFLDNVVLVVDIYDEI